MFSLFFYRLYFRLLMLISMLILCQSCDHDQNLNHQSAQDQSAQDQSIQDQSIQDQSAQDQSAQDQFVGLSTEALNDPLTCKQCHLDHFNQWSGSMHAYASKDPIFKALNAKGQRDTNGALGDFCVQCHAPMAKILGLTTDGLNLDEIPEKYQGITCAFCHQIESVDGDFNNPLFWAGDGVLRGAIADPFPNPVHRSEYRGIMNRKELKSSDMCGACHDIFTQNQVHLERTYWEWKQTSFNQESIAQQNTCGQCHMPGRDGIATIYEGVPERRLHDHLMPGVDLAIIDDFPLKEEMKNRVAEELEHLFLTEICVQQGTGGAGIDFHLENVSAGHRFPSGAAIDRRLWVHLKAFDLNGQLVFETGNVAETQGLQEASQADENLIFYGDLGFKADGSKTHFFWEIQSVSRNTLPSPTSFLNTDPRYEDPHVIQKYRIASEFPIQSVEAQIYLKAIDQAMIDDLIDSGDLDPKYQFRIPAMTVGPLRKWTLGNTTFKMEFNADCSNPF